MRIQSFTGKITPQYQVINQSSFINFGEAVKNFKPDSLKFDSVKIDLGIAATGGFETAYDLKLIGKNSVTGKSVTIQIPPSRLVLSGSIVSKTEQLDNSSGWAHGFLDQLFSIIPDTLTIVGHIVVNPDFVQSSITDTAKLYNTMNVYFPVKVGIYGGKISTTTKSDFPKDIVNNVKRGQMNFEVYNHIPLQMAFHAALMGKATPTSPYDTLMHIPTDNIPRVVLPAHVNTSGVSSDSVLSTFSFVLADTSITKLSTVDSMYVQFDIQTTPTGVQIKPVRIQSTDFISVRASGNLIYMINKQ
jgi:hypothetical protein